MTPIYLFQYLAAIAGGVLLIGAAAFFVACLFALVVGWAKRTPHE